MEKVIPNKVVMSSIRLKQRDLSIVTEAAKILDITRSEFMRLAAAEKAARVILERESDRNSRDKS